MRKNSKKRKQQKAIDDEQVPPKQSWVNHSYSPAPLCFNSPVSLFESLIKPMGTEQFFREYWEKKPLHLQQSDSSAASYFQSLFQLSDLQSLCSQTLYYYRDINVVRCINGKKNVLNKEGQVKRTVLNKFLAENKATIQFHQPQRFKDELWRILEKLECFFGALVGSNVYITPQEAQGLPAHYDDVEIFILQLEGQKRWRLYSPTVPLAAEYSVESEERIGSPTHDVVLKTGDVLYFPRGTIHQASTLAGLGHSTHLTLSTYQRMSWRDLLLDTFPSLLCDSSRTDISLREGIPRRVLLGSSEGPDTRTQLATGLRSLADEIETGNLEVRATLMKRDFIMNRLPPYNQQLTPSGKIPALEDTVRLRFKDHMVITVEPSQEISGNRYNTYQSNSNSVTSPSVEHPSYFFSSRQRVKAGPIFSLDQVVFVLHSLKNERTRHMMGDEKKEHVISTGLKYPLSHLPALQQLQQAEHLAVTQLHLPTQEAKLNLVLALWSESLLNVV